MTFRRPKSYQRSPSTLATIRLEHPDKKIFWLTFFDCPFCHKSSHFHKRSELRIFYQKPCKLKDCPPNIKFGAWSDWSECSLSCKTDYEQKSVKSRIRTLEYYVKEHEDFKTETQECSVPMCPFKCPNIHLRLKKDESDILGLKVAKFS